MTQPGGALAAPPARTPRRHEQLPRGASWSGTRHILEASRSLQTQWRCMVRRFEHALHLTVLGLSMTSQQAAGRTPSTLATALPCRGETTMDESRPDARTVIRHSGREGAGTTIVSGPPGTIAVHQDGPCNHADVRQSGAASNNRATVTQSGSGNRAVVRQGPPAGKPR